MTKKHYEAIATRILHAQERGLNPTHAGKLAEELAHYFATENPKFNRSRFLEACGITQ